MSFCYKKKIYNYLHVIILLFFTIYRKNKLFKTNKFLFEKVFIFIQQQFFLRLAYS